MPPRRSRLPMISSASIGARRSMSRDIEAVSPDSGVVSMVRLCRMEDALDGKHVILLAVVIQ